MTHNPSWYERLKKELEERNASSRDHAYLQIQQTKAMLDLIKGALHGIDIEHKQVLERRLKDLNNEHRQLTEEYRLSTPERRSEIDDARRKIEEEREKLGNEHHAPGLYESSGLFAINEELSNFQPESRDKGRRSFINAENRLRSRPDLEGASRLAGKLGELHDGLMRAYNINMEAIVERLKEALASLPDYAMERLKCGSGVPREHEYNWAESAQIHAQMALDKLKESLKAVREQKEQRQYEHGL